jgi:hypothetical protein
MNQVTGKNFLISVDYCDMGNLIGIGARLYDDSGEPRGVAVRVDIDGSHSDLAFALEQLAERIRGLA